MNSMAVPNVGQNDPLNRLPKDLQDDNLLVGLKAVNDVNDSHVQEVGKFAVEEHNKQTGEDLKFVCVLTAKTKNVLDGIVYHLVIEAKKDQTAKTYEAVVWEKQTFKKLILFRALV